MPKSPLFLLIAGLMLTTTLPLAARHFKVSDIALGFIVGLGISLELWALISIIRYKNKSAQSS